MLKQLMLLQTASALALALALPASAQDQSKRKLRWLLVCPLSHSVAGRTTR